MIEELAKRIKSKKISREELFKEYLGKIKKNDGAIHAFLSTVAGTGPAVLQGLSLQKGALSGIPYALKDNILFKGVQATAGSKILENYIAPYDATVVKKLRASGAVLIGKTNLDEFAMGSSTENSAYGATKNPWDVSKVPGGSSGGSAAAVSAGFAAFALGSDTGGSIRQPASFCGVVGFKPTYGRVSRYGLIAMSSSLDQIGTFTKTVADAALVMEVIAGHDELDATSSSLRVPKYSKEITKKHHFTIGIPDEYFGEGVDSSVVATVEQAIKLLEKNGHRIKKISLPHTNATLPVYYIIMPVEVASNLSRYDGIKYGYSVENDLAIKKADSEGFSVADITELSRAKGFGVEAKRRIMLGTYASSAGYFDAYYLKAQQIKTLVLRDFENAFGEVDLIATPTTPEVAFRFGAKKDPVNMYKSDVLTVPANIAGIPALTVPCGFVGGLPVGLQIMGPHWSESEVLNLGHQFEGYYGQFPEPKL